MFIFSSDIYPFIGLGSHYFPIFFYTYLFNELIRDDLLSCFISFSLPFFFVGQLSYEILYYSFRFHLHRYRYVLLFYIYTSLKKLIILNGMNSKRTKFHQITHKVRGIKSKCVRWLCAAATYNNKQPFIYVFILF